MTDSRQASKRLDEALRHIERLATYVPRLDDGDDAVSDAIAMRLSAAIEALSHLDRSQLDATFGEQWPAIWATRNRIAHGYALADHAVIERIVRVDLPGFIAAILEIKAAVDSELEAG